MDSTKTGSEGWPGAPWGAPWVGIAGATSGSVFAVCFTAPDPSGGSIANSIGRPIGVMSMHEPYLLSGDRCTELKRR